MVLRSSLFPDADACWVLGSILCANRALVAFPAMLVMSIGISMTWRLRCPWGASSDVGRFEGMLLFVFVGGSTLVGGRAFSATSGDDFSENSDPAESLCSAPS
ncbi:hypothetical protein K466DRAFT_399705 [Polyporus arcularius HHB13444]|uniref:Uncharacterized protein n=1 Tax=Polyporus arcularius HHB13444 TaxID=1314778 RepID=A0A5C3PMQ1_9APHY|nr:hypothetical protein K466DRAFT_399705 [Polyporus arcularius HHB13444]